ncbi:hypothetical protein HK105_206086 [Polyrhizophydium stewartii]|uniref:Spermidine synthase n=1 Tax=Polyrhizophydium stewartii TaxID=2732419 RepID=A0ABR4N4B5_9FUNG
MFAGTTPVIASMAAGWRDSVQARVGVLPEMPSSFASVALLALAAALANDAEPRLLAPYYGQYLSSITPPAAVGGALAAGIVAVRFILGRDPAGRDRDAGSTPSPPLVLSSLASVLISLAPAAAALAAPWAGSLGPAYGPVVAALPVTLATTCALLAAAHVAGLLPAVVLARLMLLSTGFSQRALAASLALVDLDATLAMRCLGLDSPFGPTPAPEAACTAVPAPRACSIMMAAAVLGALSALAAALPSSGAACSRKKASWSLAVVLLVVCGAAFNTLSGALPQCTAWRPEAPQSSVLADFHLRAHEESVTGYVAVVDAPTEYGPIRLMRCDHSILGGIFLEHEGDSIFGSFYFLDFARYIKRAKPSAPRAALQLGLGIGVTAKTLARAGIAVDVVELDPVVYEYARSYFDLPEPRARYLGDGRVYIDSVAADQSYDYVLHDVFTGGVVPGPMFSIEAVQSVKRILKSDGVLAMNYVGRIETNGTRAVIKTLQSAFSHIQLFVESLEYIESETAMYNMVIFAADFEMEFAKPTRADLAVGGVYVSMLETFRDNRVPLERIMTDPEVRVITDKHNPLAGMQVESARKHWGVMRQLFKSEFWSNMF